jgi:hypothetical protein
MSDDAIDRLIFECREASIDAARVDAACSQLASYRRHMAELEAEREDLHARLARAVELLRQVDTLPSLRVTSHPIVLDVRAFLEEQARERAR